MHGIGIKNPNMSSDKHFYRSPRESKVDDSEKYRRLELFGYSRGYHNPNKSLDRIRSVVNTPLDPTKLQPSAHRPNKSMLLDNQDFDSKTFDRKMTDINGILLM